MNTKRGSCTTQNAQGKAEAAGHGAAIRLRYRSVIGPGEAPRITS